MHVVTYSCLNSHITDCSPFCQRIERCEVKSSSARLCSGPCVGRCSPAPLAEDFFWPIWLDDFSTWKCAFTVDLPYVPIFSHNFSIYIYIYSIYIYRHAHTDIWSSVPTPPHPLTPCGVGGVWYCMDGRYGM